MVSLKLNMMISLFLVKESYYESVESITLKCKVQ